MPPIFPALKGSKVALGEISDHIHIVLRGKKSTAMSAFAEQLSVSDVAAVVTYERNAWGNDKGDMATPKQVKQQKESGK
jgi:cytochrome c oxidase subunit 2